MEINFDPLYLFTFISFLLGVLVFFIRIEHRLTHLETLISVLERRILECQPNLAEIIQ